MDEFIADVRLYRKYCDLCEEIFLLVDALMGHFVYERSVHFWLWSIKKWKVLQILVINQEEIYLSNRKYEEKIIGCSA